MKKLYTLAAFAAIACTANAQVRPTGFYSIPVPVTSAEVSHSADRNIDEPDTTGIKNYVDFQPQWRFGASNNTPNNIIGALGGGYCFGNNNWGLNICAQCYSNINTARVGVIGAIVRFAAKQQDGASSATSKVVVNVYDVLPNKAYNTDGTSTFNSTVKNAPGPSGASKASANILFSDIDTSRTGWNPIMFATPAVVSGDFAVAVDASFLAAGDTVGIVTDPKGSAGEQDLALNKYTGDIKWYVSDEMFSTAAHLFTGDMDCNLAIWAIVSPAAGVDEYFNGMKLTTYPNPTVDKATIEYTLEKNSKNVSVLVFDAKGTKVLEKNYAEQVAGTYTLDVPTANLNAGNYFYQLNANGHNFTKQLVITK